MQKKGLFSLIKWIVAAGVLLVGVPVAGFLGWIALQPREIAELTPRLEQALNPQDGRFHIDIDKVVLSWGGWQSPLRISVHDARLLNPQGVMVASMPQMHVKLSLHSLLYGRVIPSSVTVVTPRMHIFQDAEGTFYLGSSDADSTPIALREIFLREASRQPSDAAHVSSMFDSGLQKLTIQGAKIHFASELADLALEIPAADIIVQEQAGKFKGRVDFYTREEKQDDVLIASFFSYQPYDNHLSVDLNFKDLDVSRFSKVSPALAALGGMQLPLTGKIALQGMLPQHVETLDFAVKSLGGKVAYPEWLPEEVDIGPLLIKGRIEDDLRKLTLQQAILSVEKADISMRGEVMDPLSAPAINGTLEIENFSSTLLKKYWPQGVAHNARNWVFESIHDAEVPKASMSVNLSPQMLEAERLPEEAVLVKIEVKNARVDYMPEYPPAEKASGVVTITGNTLTADIDTANVLENTTLRGPAKVTIPSLAEENITITLDIPVRSTAADVITFMKSTPYKVPEDIKLDPAAMTGDVLGQLHMDIIDYTSPQPDDVTFTLSANIDNIGQQALFKGVDLAQFKGDIEASTESLTFEGEGLINGYKTNINTSVKKGGQGSHKVMTTVPANVLSQFGVPLEEVIDGNLRVALDWQQRGGKADRIVTDVDLTAAKIAVEDMNIVKASGEKASFHMEALLDDQQLTAQKFMLTMPDGQAAGSGAIDIKTNQLADIVLDHFTLGKNDFSGEYKPLPDGHYLRLNAVKLDLSFLNEDEDETRPETKKEENFWKDFEVPELDVRAQIKSLVFEEGRELSNVSLAIDCDKIRCSSMNFSADAGEVPFYAEIGQRGNGRVFKAFTSDAGAFLKHLDVFEDMKGGRLSIVGIYQDGLPNSPLIGKLTISEHRVRNVPLLAKLLTLATFTGFVDALSGKGLMFQKLIMPFKFENLNLTLQDAKTAGPSVGITASGPINLKEDRMDIRGTVVPAYMFNSIISSIPLIGNIYGALAGDGLVAMNYSIKGSIDDSEVSVNPLSALTPGFLRGFFNIFDPVKTKDVEAGASAAEALQALGAEIEQLEKELPDFSEKPANNGKN